MVELEPVIDKLVDMLHGKGSSRIAILGAEGMGKTTCSLSALHDARISERFAAIYYLSCECITDAQLLLVGLAQILGIPPAQSLANLFSSISIVLNKPDTLLCLDSFETPWGPLNVRNAVEDLLSAISTTPNLSLIVAIKGTERPLRVAWSEPLLPPLDKLSQRGAEMIVQDIAGVRVVDQNIHSLLVAAEGMPLAITLISSLLRDGVETSSSLWRRWLYMERRKESVWGEYVSFTQVSKIDAAIAISIDSPQMNKHPDATTILAALSLLPDGFSSSPADLEKLLNFLEPNEVHRCLRTLQNLALAWTDETSNPHRIRILPAVESYCLKFFSSEFATMRPKLTEYYIDIVLSIGFPTSEPPQRTEMEREIKNMHSVFRGKYAAGGLQEAELQRLIRATYFLTLWSTQLGYLLEDIPQQAIDASAALPIPRARCLLAKCGMYRQAGRFDEAEQCCKQALSIFQEADDLSGQGDAISTISAICADRGQPSRGEETSSESKELLALSRKRRQLDRDEEEGKNKLLSYEGNAAIPRWQVALVHLQLGVPTVYMTRPRLDSTLESLGRALGLYEKDKHAMGQATALFHMAFAYLLKNELTYARAIVERALGLSRAVVTQVANSSLPSAVGMMFNDLTSESEMQAVFNTLLGHIRIREDRLAEAKDILKKAVKKKAAYSVTPDLRLGWCYLRQNKLDKAEKIFNDLQKRCKSLRFWEEEHEALGYQGVIHLRKGNLDAAEAVLKESRNRGLLLYAEIDVLQVLGDVYVEKGQLQDAEDILSHAMRLQKHIDSAFGQGNVLRSLGDVHARRGKFVEAMSAYEGARAFHRAAHWLSEEVEDVERIAFLQRELGNRRAAEEALSETFPLFKDDTTDDLDTSDKFQLGIRKHTGDNEHKMNITDLPSDILLEISKNLVWIDILRLRKVCKFFNDITKARPICIDLFRKVQALSLQEDNDPIFLERPIEMHTSAELEHIVLRWQSVQLGWTSPEENPIARERLISTLDSNVMHLVKGGRWLLVVDRVSAAISYYDLEASVVSGRPLAPSMFVEDLGGASSNYSSRDHLGEPLPNILLAVDVDDSSTTLSFNLAISVIREASQTAASDSEELVQCSKVAKMAVWRVDLQLDEQNKGVGLISRLMADFLHRPELCDQRGLQIRGTHILLQALYTLDKKRICISIIDWEEANGKGNKYLIRIIPSSRWTSEHIRILPQNKFLFKSHQAIALYDYSNAPILAADAALSTFLFPRISPEWAVSVNDGLNHHTLSDVFVDPETMQWRVTFAGPRGVYGYTIYSHYAFLTTHAPIPRGADARTRPDTNSQYHKAVAVFQRSVVLMKYSWPGVSLLKPYGPTVVVKALAHDSKPGFSPLVDVGSGRVVISGPASDKKIVLDIGLIYK
ncbi:TPR-like protein [Pholiota conissans]|uniref:TPR-like protein n=1 Tax=Pholiota conissans TaxID=109636 RepID=A0A9P5Z8M8_9AGAR|nr:TPR-like protein [Pholiota conissans]